MSVNCGDIAAAIEKMAPLTMAESWDNVGLLVGQADQSAPRVLLTVDVTLSVIEEAIEAGAGLIVSHHPFPFQPLRQIRTDSVNGTMLSKLLKHEIAVYAAHTNLDRASGGVNDALAAQLGLIDTKPLQLYKEPLVKIVVFVPEEYETKVWTAMSEAGAGHVGNYSDCSFRTKGVGTFMPQAGSRPFIGQAHQLSSVAEVKLETIAPASQSAKIVQAMLGVHPYEEVAYDVFALQNDHLLGGLGRIGRLSAKMSLENFAVAVKTALGIDGIRVYGNMATQIDLVAVCGGSGMDCAKQACREGASVLVTGDIRYHEAQEALAQGLCLIDAGHFATEYPVLAVLQNYLQNYAEKESWNSRFMIARKQGPIFSQC